MIGDPLEDVAQIEFRIKTVQLGCAQQRTGKNLMNFFKNLYPNSLFIR
jgi:hypothetical protein